MIDNNTIFQNVFFYIGAIELGIVGGIFIFTGLTWFSRWFPKKK